MTLTTVRQPGQAALPRFRDEPETRESDSRRVTWLSGTEEGLAAILIQTPSPPLRGGNGFYQSVH